MSGRTILAAAMLAGMGLSLSACGDGSVNSTPPPAPTPTPTPPPPTYTKIADLTGDRTFQTGGVQYDAVNSGFANGATANFGSGTTVAYTAATDTYTLTAPGGGTTASFAPSNALPPNPNTPNVQQWQVINGTTTDILTLIVPKNSAGVALSYMIIGTWGHVTPTATT